MIISGSISLFLALRAAQPEDCCALPRRAFAVAPRISPLAVNYHLLSRRQIKQHASPKLCIHTYTLSHTHTHLHLIQAFAISVANNSTSRRKRARLEADAVRRRQSFGASRILHVFFFNHSLSLSLTLFVCVCLLPLRSLVRKSVIISPLLLLECFLTHSRADLRPCVTATPSIEKERERRSSRL